MANVSVLAEHAINLCKGTLSVNAAGSSLFILIVTAEISSWLSWKSSYFTD